MRDGTLELLLEQLDQAYDRKSWHGTNLRGSIRGVSAREAVWRPAPGRHNIHELVVHAAYWKYTVARRFCGGKRGSFPLEGSNWFDRSTADEQSWRADVRLLEDTHRQLCAIVARLDSRVLPRPLPRSTVTYQGLISGIIAHDFYHAGQIQLLKRPSAREKE